VAHPARRRTSRPGPRPYPRRGHRRTGPGRRPRHPQRHRRPPPPPPRLPRPAAVQAVVRPSGRVRSPGVADHDGHERLYVGKVYPKAGFSRTGRSGPVSQDPFACGMDKGLCGDGGKVEAFPECLVGTGDGKPGSWRCWRESAAAIARRSPRWRACCLTWILPCQGVWRCRRLGALASRPGRRGRSGPPRRRTSRVPRRRAG